MIPILIICYNNHIYVDNMIKQIKKINPEYFSYITIINNSSTDKNTISYLETCSVNIIQNKNNGPWISQNCNIHIYDTLPEQYIITDPDLQLHKNIPSNFIEILSNLSEKYQCRKIGFALDISDYDLMFQTNNYAKFGLTIYDWEKRFWENKINDSEYELYNAEIDTTFCLINKKYINSNIRVADNFTCKHLPWYKNNPLINIYDNYQNYINIESISSIAITIREYVEENFYKINKNNEYFFINKDKNDPNLNFWLNIYNNWENETFQVFDNYLDKNKIFIDIGGWIGTTCIYGSRKSKHVYVVEADKESFSYLISNTKLNNKNITCINKAIYNKSNLELLFGKNNFLENSKLNDSTSQLYIDSSSNDCYKINTITIHDIFDQYQINQNEISLIKVDIEGGEEYILNDLFEIYSSYHIPMYISFHYSWWKNKDLDRFTFLSSNHKYSIINNPFISLLFT
jgi:FkbM family methyltransferase